MTEIQQVKRHIIFTAETHNFPTGMAWWGGGGELLGYNVNVLLPKDPSEASEMTEIQQVKRHIIFTAETHNFPTGMAWWGGGGELLGYNVNVLLPKDPSEASEMTEIQQVKRHIIFTAETHNFPTGKAWWKERGEGGGGVGIQCECPAA